MMDVLLKLEPGAYVLYRALLETMVSAGDRLGVDCPCGRKEAARQ